MSGSSLSVPVLPGIYAEIHWRTRGVRIGESGASLRQKFAHDARWLLQMHSATARPQDLRRLRMSNPHPIVVHAAKDGPAAFEFFVVSSDPRLADRLLRQEIERSLFSWIAKHPEYVNWNRQVSWH
jgi:hypothetical protein